MEYNVEFKKNKISLDFCLAHAFIFIGVRESPKVDFSSAMEKKRNNISTSMIQKEASTLIKVKNDYSSFALMQKKQKIKIIPMKLLRTILF